MKDEQIDDYKNLIGEAGRVLSSDLFPDMTAIERDSTAYLQLLYETLYRIQKLRIQIGNAVDGVTKDRQCDVKTALMLHDYLDNKLHELEDELENNMVKELPNFPIYTQWLNNIRGMGGKLSAGLIAYMYRFDKEERVMRGIERFEKVSALWKYFGLHVVDIYELTCRGCGGKDYTESDSKNELIDKIRMKCKKCRKQADFDVEKIHGKAPSNKRGSKSSWKPEAKVLAWKIGGQLNKNSHSNSYYKRAMLYYKIGEISNNKPKLLPLREAIGRLLALNYGDYKKGSLVVKDSTEKGHVRIKKLEEVVGVNGRVSVILRPAHIQARVERKTTKLLLSHLWQKWRLMEGLEARPSYPVEKQGRTEFPLPISDATEMVFPNKELKTEYDKYIAELEKKKKTAKAKKAKKEEEVVAA